MSPEAVSSEVLHSPESSIRSLASYFITPAVFGRSFKYFGNWILWRLSSLWSLSFKCAVRLCALMKSIIRPRCLHSTAR